MHARFSGDVEFDGLVPDHLLVHAPSTDLIIGPCVRSHAAKSSDRLRALSLDDTCLNIG